MVISLGISLLLLIVPFATSRAPGKFCAFIFVNQQLKEESFELILIRPWLQ